MSESNWWCRSAAKYGNTNESDTHQRGGGQGERQGRDGLIFTHRHESDADNMEVMHWFDDGDESASAPEFSEEDSGLDSDGIVVSTMEVASEEDEDDEKSCDSSMDAASVEDEDDPRPPVPPSFCRRDDFTLVSHGEFRHLCDDLRDDDSATSDYSLTTEVKVKHYPSDYSQQLGEALSNNELATSIDLDLHILCLDGIHTLLLRSIESCRSLRKMSFEAGRHAAAPPLDVDDYEDPDDVTESCLEAMAVNGNITEFSLGIYIPTERLSCLFRCTEQCCKLDLFLGAYNSVGLDIIASAFSTIQCLEHLVLRPGSNVTTVETVLAQLSGHKRLRELELLSGNGHTLQVLETVLLGTAPLIHLRLQSFQINGNQCDDLVTCLLLHCSESLGKLSLHHCALSARAATHLIRYLQLSSDNSDQLCELSLVGCCQYSDGANDDFVPLAARMLQVRASRRDCQLLLADERRLPKPTIGSSLQYLSLTGSFCAGFWKFMNRHASTSQLVGASMLSEDPDDWRRMSRCLPKLVRLRKLEINDIWFRQSSARFLRAMRRNTSVYHLSILPAGHGGCKNLSIGMTRAKATFNFSAEDLALILAYTMRNEFVPKLLRKDPIDLTEHNKRKEWLNPERADVDETRVRRTYRTRNGWSRRRQPIRQLCTVPMRKPPPEIGPD